MFGKKMMMDMIKDECDDLIIDIMTEKLDIKVDREGDDIVFRVRFAGKLIKEDKVSIR